MYDVFGDYNFEGEFEDDGYDARRFLTLRVIREANGKAFEGEIASKGGVVGRALAWHAKSAKDTFSSELENMAIPLLFSERGEVSVRDFLLGSKTGDADVLASRASAIAYFAKEVESSIHLFAGMREWLPALDIAESGVTSGLSAYLSLYSSENYEVNLWSLALLAITFQSSLGDDPEHAPNPLVHEWPEDMLVASGRIISAYCLMGEVFVAGAKEAVAEMHRMLYDSL